MLAKRIIPTLLCRGRQLYKGKTFDAWRSVGHAAQAMRVHGRRGVDELVLLDIAATAESRGPDLALVHELSADLFIPLTVGGGVRSIEQIDQLLRAGADKVCIGSAAAETPDLIRKAADRFGSQAIVVSVDSKANAVYTRCGKDSIMVLEGHSEEQPLGTSERHLTPVELAVELAGAGAGEVLLNSIDRDGAMGGYDLDLTRVVSAVLGIPVIACGGCGSYEHMHEALKAGADAVAAGALFQFTDCTPKGAAQYLKSKGWETRCN